MVFFGHSPHYLWNRSFGYLADFLKESISLVLWIVPFVSTLLFLALNLIIYCLFFIAHFFLL